MKTIHLSKVCLIILLLFFCKSSLCYAQQKELEKSTFVRVYSKEGRKIAKGHIVFVRDSVLGLKRGNRNIELNVRDINTIKTKRSGGHNVLSSATTGAAIGIFIGVSTAEPDKILGYSAGEGALAFGTLGAIGGAAIGGIAAALKKHRTYVISGDMEKWSSFVNAYSQK